MQELKGFLEISAGTNFTKGESEAHRNLYQIPRTVKVRITMDVTRDINLNPS